LLPECCIKGLFWAKPAMLTFWIYAMAMLGKMEQYCLVATAVAGGRALVASVLRLFYYRR